MRRKASVQYVELCAARNPAMTRKMGRRTMTPSATNGHAGPLDEESTAATTMGTTRRALKHARVTPPTRATATENGNTGRDRPSPWNGNPEAPERAAAAFRSAVTTGRLA